MAVRCCSSTHFMVRKSCPIGKPGGGIMVMMLNNSNSNVSAKRIPALEITSSLRNKVFEDLSKGIVCYRDEDGEIVCEGYDEGPRLHQDFPRKTYNSRDAEIIGLLQQNWLQIVKGGDEADAFAGPEDFNWNGYNTYY